MSHPRFREIAFETNTNNVLATINSHLVNEPEKTTPNYKKRSGATDYDLLHRLRTMLSVIDTAEYVDDVNLDAVRYKIYLCYALINYLERNNVMAKQFFQKTCASRDGRESARPYESIMHSTGIKSQNRLKHNKKLQKKLLVLGSIIVSMFLIMYPIATSFIKSVGAVSYTNAPNHIGESLKIKGKIVSTSYRNGTDFLDFCSDFRNCQLSLVILHNNTSKFGDISKYSGNNVIVTGTISSYQGRTQIVLSDPSQLNLQ